MAKDFSLKRREFLKATGAGAAGAAIASLTPGKAFGKTAAQWPEINTKGISNLKVVCCHDPLMIPRSYGTSFTAQNNATNIPQIKNNLDKMAMELAGVSTAAAAWAKIFTLPSGKALNTVKAAIKVNTINGANEPRIGVVAKVCEELIKLGLSASNIYVYDATTGTDDYKSYASGQSNAQLPIPLSGVVDWDCQNSSAAVSPLITDLGITAPNAHCPKMIANGNIDILVNCAVNKSHDMDKGGITGAMKNHFGTFDPHGLRSPSDSDGHGNFAYIVAINKHRLIMGGTPARQQLCITDSLWGSETCCGDVIGKTNPGRLIMGTFGPAVDYLVAKANWTDWVGPTNNVLRWETNDVTESFLTSFGYTTAQTNALAFTNISPATPVISQGNSKELNTRILRFQIAGGPGRIPNLWPSIDLFSVYNRCGC